MGDPRGKGTGNRNPYLEDKGPVTAIEEGKGLGQSGEHARRSRIWFEKTMHGRIIADTFDGLARKLLIGRNLPTAVRKDTT